MKKNILTFIRGLISKPVEIITLVISIIIAWNTYIISESAIITSQYTELSNLLRLANDTTVHKDDLEMILSQICSLEKAISSTDNKRRMVTSTQYKQVGIIAEKLGNYQLSAYYYNIPYKILKEMKPELHSTEFMELYKLAKHLYRLDNKWEEKLNKSNHYRLGVKYFDVDIKKNHQLDESASEIFSKMCDILLVNGSYEKAIECIEIAIDIEKMQKVPSNYLYQKGYALDKIGKYDEALKFYSEAINLNPEYTHYYYAKSYVYFKLNNIKKAISMIDIALQKEPENLSYKRLKEKIVNNN